MVAHILMTQLDPDLPASLSPAVVTDLLRGELGFGGVVFTDDLTMGAITQNYGLGEAAVLTVEAGCDMLLVCHGRDSVDARPLGPAGGGGIRPHLPGAAGRERQTHPFPETGVRRERRAGLRARPERPQRPGGRGRGPIGRASP